MKHQWICILAITGLMGCSLNEYCDEDQYKQDDKCYRCRVGEHLNADKTGCEPNTDTDCGAKHSNCSSIRNVKNSNCDVDNGVCKVSCKDGFNESNGRCVDPNAQTCMVDADCSIPQNSTSVKCDGYVCFIQCAEGFHLEKATNCVANAYISCRSDEDCLSMDGVEDAKCNNELCSVKSCKTGFHLNDSNSYCDMDTAIACGMAKTNCTELEHVSKADCQEGYCHVESCRTGFHSSPDADACDEDSVYICGNSKIDCTEISGSVDQKCDQSVCRFECKDGFVKDAQSCVFDHCASGTELVEQIDACLNCSNESIDIVLCTESECMKPVYDNPLECIKQGIKIVSGVNNATVNFKNLRYVYNDLELSATGSDGRLPTLLKFPKLESVRDLLVNGKSREPLEVDFSSLKYVNGNVNLKSITAETLEFSKLQEVAGNFELHSIYGNSLSFPRLTHVNGESFKIYSFGTPNLDLPVLENVNAHNIVIDDDSITSYHIHIGKITNNTNSSTNGTFSIDDNAPLSKDSELVIDGLKELNKMDLYIAENSYLKIKFNDLKKIDGKLTVWDYGVEMPVLQEVAEIFLRIYDTMALDELITVNGDMSLNYSANTSYSFNKLQTVTGKLTIDARSLSISESLSYPELTTVGELYIQCNSNNPRITSINMPKLKKVNGTVKVCNCPGLKAENCNLGDNTCTILSSCN